MKKLIYILLSVALISTSVTKVQASWFSDCFVKEVWQGKENYDMWVMPFMVSRVNSESYHDTPRNKIIVNVKEEIIKNQRLQGAFQVVFNEIEEHIKKPQQQENTKGAFYQILDIMNEDKKTYYDKLSLLYFER
jgi:hypothetical protein